jgi:hypothetical protein
MTNSCFPFTLIGSPLIEARVKSFTAHDTASGDRIYAVFTAVDGSILGLWSHADHPALKHLRIGDRVLLKRNLNGHLSLAAQPVSFANRIGIFALLQRLWRLL